MKSILILVVMASALFLESCSEDQERPSGMDYTTADEFLNELDFSGSVLVRDRDIDLVRKGYGKADQMANLINNPSLIYRIGSMTKAFTAIAIIHLKRDGLITSYDQLISDFVDDFPHGNEITLRHLLTHYSGIPDYLYAVADVDANQELTPDDIFDVIVEAISNEGLEFEPGAKYSYSNSNYMLLGLLIEQLTKMSYHEYLNLKINMPLGLTNTEKGPDEMKGDGYAKGYINGHEVEPYQMQIAYSAGDLVSTISDLEKWGDALLGDDYLSTDEKSEIFADPYSEDGYYTVGFGWFTMKVNGKIMYFHGGDIDGYTSFMGLLPETGSMIIWLCNEQDQWELRNQIQETLPKYEF